MASLLDTVALPSWAFTGSRWGSPDAYGGGYRMDESIIRINGWDVTADDYDDALAYLSPDRRAKITVKEAEYANGRGYLAQLWQADTPFGELHHTDTTTAFDVVDLRSRVNVLLGELDD